MSPLAYLDPGTGSMILQAVLGGIAGIAVLVKVGWRRIIGLFSPRRRRAFEAEQAAKARAAEADGDASAAPASGVDEELVRTE